MTILSKQYYYLMVSSVYVKMCSVPLWIPDLVNIFMTCLTTWLRQSCPRRIFFKSNGIERLGDYFIYECNS